MQGGNRHIGTVGIVEVVGEAREMRPEVCLLLKLEGAALRR